jgi:molybdenum cofactor synthesis domain-containing protein
VTTVLLFARAREVAGVRSVELDGDTVSAVVAAAGQRFGAEFAELSATCTVVVDGEIVPRSDHASTAPGAELAILPPVSGGAVEGHGEHHRSDASTSIRAVVVTVSDRASAGVYDDRTGPALERVLADRVGATVVGREVVPDDVEQIRDAIVRWCDGGGCDLLVTNGGTGLSPRDVTPEATRGVLDVEAPGLGELMRAAGLAHTPMAALSRQVAGRRGATIVLNVPGSEKGAVESLEAVAEILPHAVTTAGSAP